MIGQRNGFFSFSSLVIACWPFISMRHRRKSPSALWKFFYSDKGKNQNGIDKFTDSFSAFDFDFKFHFICWWRIDDGRGRIGRSQELKESKNWFQFRSWARFYSILMKTFSICYSHTLNAWICSVVPLKTSTKLIKLSYTINVEQLLDVYIS